MKSHFSLAATRVLLFVNFIVLFGCNNSSTPTSSSNTNIAVVANTTNAFSYVLSAKDYSSSVSYDLTFLKDSIAYTITTSYGSGSLVIAIIDSSGADIVRDTVSSNEVIAATKSGKIPRKCFLTYGHFNGDLSLTLAARASGQ